MVNRFFLLVILTSSCLNFFGCTSKPRIKFPADEIYRHTKTSVESVQLCSKIQSITTEDDNRIRVQNAMVQSDAGGDVLMVKTTDGEKRRIGFGQIKMFSGKPSDIVSFFSASGKIDLDRKIITGLNSNHSPVIIPLSDACFVTGISDKNELNELKTLGAIGVASLIVYLLAEDFKNHTWF